MPGSLYYVFYSKNINGVFEYFDNFFQLLLHMYKFLALQKLNQNIEELLSLNKRLKVMKFTTGITFLIFSILNKF